MPALTEARHEALRRARQAARVVLAKHTCVTGGSGKGGLGRPSLLHLPVEGDQTHIGREGDNLGRDEHAAGAGGS